MKCPKGHEMQLLLTSYVCDACDKPEPTAADVMFWLDGVPVYGATLAQITFEGGPDTYPQ